MHALRSRRSAPASHRRSGITLMELLLVIAVGVQTIALLIPAVQKVRDAAARVERSEQWIELASFATDHADAVEALGDASVRAVRAAIRMREVDPEVFGDLLDQHMDALDENAMLQRRVEAALQIEMDAMVDRNLQALLDASIDVQTALEANIEDLDELLGGPNT